MTSLRYGVAFSCVILVAKFLLWFIFHAFQELNCGWRGFPGSECTNVSWYLNLLVLWIIIVRLVLSVEQMF